MKKLLFRLIYHNELIDILNFRYKVTKSMENSRKDKYLFDYYMGKKSAIEAIIYRLSGLSY